MQLLSNPKYPIAALQHSPKSVAYKRSFNLSTVLKYMDMKEGQSRNDSGLKILV